MFMIFQLPEASLKSDVHKVRHLLLPLMLINLLKKG